LNKKQTFSLFFSNEALIFFHTLYLENYLDYYFVNNNRVFIKVKFTASGFPIIKYIYFFFKKGQRKFISFNSFFESFKAFHKQSFFFTSTSIGICSDITIKRIGSGGRALFFIKILFMIVNFLFKVHPNVFLYFYSFKDIKQICIYDLNYLKRYSFNLPKCFYLYVFSQYSFILFSSFFKQYFFFKKLYFFLKKRVPFTSSLFNPKFTHKFFLKGLGFRSEIINVKFLKLFMAFSYYLFVYIPFGIDLTLLKNQIFITQSSNKTLLGSFSNIILKLKKASLYKNKGLFFHSLNNF
jgi:hypothetical protein